jgi:hypothetical protein
MAPARGLENPIQLAAAEPAESLPAKPLPLGDAAAIPVVLWVPVEVGGGRRNALSVRQ